jgi:hypothetical protein
MARQKHSRNRGDIVHMIAQCNEQIEKELGAAGLHLHLHSPATLEGASAADDKGEVVCSKFRVSVGRIGVCVACGG